MFGSLGLPEILFILVIALLVFGPRRLPEIGRTIGKALGEFRRATTDLKRTIDTEVTLEEVRQSPPPSPPRPAITPAETPYAEPGDSVDSAAESGETGDSTAESGVTGDSGADESGSDD